jgi:hypothetical protein
VIRALALLPLFLATGAARDPLAGRVAGPPVECIQLSRRTAPEIVDGATILYRESGRRTYRTGPAAACPGLRPRSPIVAEVHGRKLCRGDRFRVSYPPNGGISTAFCRFGLFVPYDKS